MRLSLSPPAALGLPAGVAACLFDLDGVLTDTAALHSAAWREMFDSYLRRRSGTPETAFVPFDPIRDYHNYVDGKPRDDGVRCFLKSRGIELPEGGPGDAPSTETVHRLGRRKNDIVLRLMRRSGVRAYAGSIRYVEAVRESGRRAAVVSSSENCGPVLDAAHIEDLFDERIDGIVAERDHLIGKPAPDTFLAAARALGVTPEHAAVFEDALAGVEAGRAGGFAFVVGVNRTDQADDLRAHGADIVVADLAQLLDVNAS